VKLLLAGGDVEVNAEDWCGRMPLSLAAINGHDAVVGLLRCRGEYGGATPPIQAPDLLDNDFYRVWQDGH
jgi:hypothetical protein